MDKTLESLFEIAGQFETQGTIVDVQEFRKGLVNDTFIVMLDSKEENQFILQRINTRVFHQPKRVMQNLRIFTEHARSRLQNAPLEPGRRWEVPRVLLTRKGEDHWEARDGTFWRAISFIGAAESRDTIQDTEHARETGFALGMFHFLISDLPPDQLAVTLEGFHITPLYLSHYNEILAKHSGERSPDVEFCVRFVRERSAWAHVLEDAKAQGRLLVRPIHGDPKVNNVLMDLAAGQAVSMVDLDTVQPGLVHYDIGDCLRSGCNPLGEDTEEWEKVRFETDLCRAILEGYLSMAREFLSDADHEYLFDGIRLIAFELGLRFFTDYLEGNVYFKAIHLEQNLARALVQFKLTESIESQEADIRTILQDLR